MNFNKMLNILEQLNSYSSNPMVAYWAVKYDLDETDVEMLCSKLI